MKFDEIACLWFMLGWFSFYPIFHSILHGSLRWAFNYSVHGIIGIGLGVAWGFFVSWFSKSTKAINRSKETNGDSLTAQGIIDQVIKEEEEE